MLLYFLGLSTAGPEGIKVFGPLSCVSVVKWLELNARASKVTGKGKKIQCITSDTFDQNYSLGNQGLH